MKAHRTPKSLPAFDSRTTSLGRHSRYSKEEEEVSHDTWRSENCRSGDHQYCWACGKNDHPTATWFKNCGKILSWEDLKQNYAKTWEEVRTFKPVGKGGKRLAGR